MIFKKTLLPFESSKHRIKGTGIEFTDHEPAEEAAQALRTAYPEQRVRIVQRQRIIEETFMGEVK